MQYRLSEDFNCSDGRQKKGVVSFKSSPDAGFRILIRQGPLTVVVSAAAFRKKCKPFPVCFIHN